MKGNCMTGCKHCIVKDLYEKREFRDKNGKIYAAFNEHIGYKHLCGSGHQKEYNEWHERNKDNTYEIYKKDFLECYEPIEMTQNLNNMIGLAEEILKKVNKEK